MTILSTNDVEQGYDYSLVLDTSTATTSSNYDEDFKLQLIKELSNLKMPWQLHLNKHLIDMMNY